jgi:hypothetical protein
MLSLFTIPSLSVSICGVERHNCASVVQLSIVWKAQHCELGTRFPFRLSNSYSSEFHWLPAAFQPGSGSYAEFLHNLLQTSSSLVQIPLTTVCPKILRIA